MLLSRSSRTGGGGEVCLRCALRLVAGAGAGNAGGRGIATSAAAAVSGGSRLLPFFDRSSSSSSGGGGRGQRQSGVFFLGNERLFVGGGAGGGKIWWDRGARRVGTSAAAVSASAESAAGAAKEAVVGTTIDSSAEFLPPHRRRQFLKKQAQLQTPPLQDQPPPSEHLIPPDASSQLSTAAQSTSSWKKSAFAYLSLTKPRLTALIVLSAATSYALFPTPALLTSPLPPDTPTLSTLTLLYLTVGTTLASAAANTLNMVLEPAYDAQMSRTRNRPLVRNLLTRRQAVLFAAVCAGTGTLALWYGVCPTVAGLGAANIVLYAGVYTPLKRISVINTWVGALVGAIPPLMGWAAAATSTSPAFPPTDTDNGHWYDEPLHLLSHPGGWLLSALLFAWQFPHFNALSTTIAAEYKAAGYQMMSWKYPALNARVALRYSLLCFPICMGLTWTGVTDRGFLVSSSLVNAWLVREAWRFWRAGGGVQGGVSRRLFWASVWHLPGVLGLACLHKAGLWEGVGRWWRGGGEEEEEEEGYRY